MSDSPRMIWRESTGIWVGAVRGQSAASAMGRKKQAGPRGTARKAEALDPGMRRNKRGVARKANAENRFANFAFGDKILRKREKRKVR